MRRPLRRRGDGSRKESHFAYYAFRIDEGLAKISKNPFEKGVDWGKHAGRITEDRRLMTDREITDSGPVAFLSISLKGG